MPYLFVLAAILLRVLPHPWNVTPLGAMFVFSGAAFRSKAESLAVPLAALLLSDYAVIHFLYGGKAEPLMHAVRHLLGKARLNAMETKILLGLARQIRWHVANHTDKIDEP